MSKKNHNKNKIVFLWLPVLMLVLIAISVDENNVQDSVQQNSRSISSTNDKKNDVSSWVDPKKATDSSPLIPVPDGELVALLERYDLNYKKDVLRVEDQTWYFSDRYSLVPKFQFKESMGKIVGGDDFYVVAELFNPLAMEKFPPLVISYNTGSIVPITGDFYVKYEEFHQASSAFRSSKQLHKIVHTKTLKELNRFQLVPERKDQIMEVFKKLKGLEGTHSIVHVDFIKKYIVRPI